MFSNNRVLSQLQAALVKLFKPDGDYIPETALFYFSGHGVRQNLGIAEGFLATSDVYSEKNFNGLSLQWLRRLLQESLVRQQIIWLDCCHKLRRTYIALFRVKKKSSCPFDAEIHIKLRRMRSLH